MRLADEFRETAEVVPLDLPIDILNFLKLVAQLHNRETNHPRVETECSSDRRLNWPRGIEAHNEVVAVGIPGLMFRGGLGQAEGTPVRVAADYAARSEDLNTGITGNSGILLATAVRFPSILYLQPAREKEQRRWMGGNVLSDLMEAARTDLRCISINQVKTKDEPGALTIAISSYNIAASGLRGCRTRLRSSSRRRDEFLRVSDLEVGGLIRRAWRCLSVGKLCAEAIGITTSCPSSLPTTLSSSSFSSSLLELFSLPPQLYTLPQNVCHCPLCPSLRFSRALAEAPHRPGVARNEFPAGKHSELLAKRLL